MRAYAAHDCQGPNFVGHLKENVTEPVPKYSFGFRHKIGEDIGDPIAKGVIDL